MIRALLIALCLACPVAAPAAGESPGRIGEDLVTAGLLSAHPDLRWRGSAVQEYERGRYDLALAQFQRAARYADKPSAAMVAEIYWEGLGVPADRALAYAWMDLAAERLWRPFLVRREQMWAELGEAERARALEVGLAVYSTYGDDVAKPRKERALARGRRAMTGSRVGAVGALTIVIPSVGGSIRISGEEFYDDKYWRAEDFWEWQASVWKDAKPGVVEVGAVAPAQ